MTGGRVDELAWYANAIGVVDGFGAPGASFKLMMNGCWAGK